MSAVLVMLTCIFALFACGGNKTQGGTRADTLRLQALRALDDSIIKLAPSAHAQIESAMKSAKDSMSYYEYYLMLTHYYRLSDNPQRVDTCVKRIVAFCDRYRTDNQKAPNPSPDPRFNSLLAGAYACQAAVNHNFHRDERGNVKLYHNTLALLAESDNVEKMPKVCANLADAYIQCSDIPKAAKWYRRALFLVDSLQMPKSETTTLYMGLAQIYLTLGDHAKALQYYKAIASNFDEMPPSMQAYYLCSFGNFYYYTRDYRAALGKFLAMKRQLEAEGMQNKFDMYLCKVNLADVYLNLDSIESSKRCLSEVEPFFEKVGDATALYYCHTIRMGVALREGRTHDVTRIISGENINDNVPYMMVSIRNRYLQKYYEAIGDYRRAYATLKDDIQYNDSLEHNRSNMRSVEIMERFRSDTLQLHHELAIEHKNADIQKAYMTVVIVMAIAIVLTLLFFVVTLHMRRRRSEDRMNIVNLKLVNMRNRISPHFVFNVLNNKIGTSSDKEASELTALSKFIRTNLDMSMQPSISLDREVDYVRKYVELERYLLGDDFTFVLSLPDNTDLTKLNGPSMFLQILTENAIVHGLKGWEGHKELHIDITREKLNSANRQSGAHMQTVLRVTDNGPGFNGLQMKKKTGLSVITQTIAATNERNRYKMRFNIRNITDSSGHVCGCEAMLNVPDGMKF